MANSATHRREYNSWIGMLSRCRDKSHCHYHRYGGRGIHVCKRWRESFSAFVEDMGPRPEGTSIDRIDNDGDYEPSNCRWATVEEQSLNSSQAHVITFNNKTLTTRGWARELGIGFSTLRNRLKRMTVERALTEPVQEDKRHVDAPSRIDAAHARKGG